MDQMSGLPAKFLLAPVYEYSVANPREFNYVAIGSGPRYNDLAKFTPDIDQILPKFLIDDIMNPLKKDTTFRIVHIDGRFNEFIPFLHAYFDLKSKQMGINLVFNDSEEMNVWRSDDHRIEIIFLPVNMYHGRDERIHYINNYTDDTWFLEKMVETTLQNKNKIIIQEFSGQSISNTRRIIYDKYLMSGQKDLFCNSVLMDDECHCGMGIDTFSPMLKPDGSFYHFPLYNYNEMRSLVGTDPQINDILKTYFLRNYRDALSLHHVNYTRKLTNAPLMFNTPEYNEQVDPDEIMHVLITKLGDCIQIFNTLGFVTTDIKNKIDDMFSKYREYKPHEWRIAMGKMFD